MILIFTAKINNLLDKIRYNTKNIKTYTVLFLQTCKNTYDEGNDQQCVNDQDNDETLQQNFSR